MEGCRRKVVSPTMHSSCLMPDRLPEIERSALKHRCVRKRGRVRGRVVCVAIYSVSTKTSKDLEMGPGCPWKRHIHQPWFQDFFSLKCCENHWLLLQCNHTLAGKWGPYFWDTLYGEEGGFHFMRCSAIKLQDIISHWSSRGTYCCALRSGSGISTRIPFQEHPFWMLDDLKTSVWLPSGSWLMMAMTIFMRLLADDWYCTDLPHTSSQTAVLIFSSTAWIFWNVLRSSSWYNQPPEEIAPGLTFEIG